MSNNARAIRLFQWILLLGKRWDDSIVSTNPSIWEFRDPYGVFVSCITRTCCRMSNYEEPLVNDTVTPLDSGQDLSENYRLVNLCVFLRHKLTTASVDRHLHVS